MYSLFTGACYFAVAPWQLGLFLFLASLGMGGEWSLAVALVMECWPERHRPKLAGVIGAACNLGFLFIALVALTRQVTVSDWRWMMLVGASPAVLALLVMCLGSRIRTLEGLGEKRRPQPGVGNLQRQAAQPDPAGHGLCRHSPDRHVGGRFGLRAHLGRAKAGRRNRQDPAAAGKHRSRSSRPRRPRNGRNCLHDFAQPRTLERTPIQDVRKPRLRSKSCCPSARSSAVLRRRSIGGMYGRRPVYFGLCLLSLLSCGYLFRFPSVFDAWFMVVAGVVGGITAAFYGWLPLYLPELFPTRVRATGQGVCVQFRSRVGGRRNALHGPVRGPVRQRLRPCHGRHHSHLFVGHDPHLVRARNQGKTIAGLM